MSFFEDKDLKDKVNNIECVVGRIEVAIKAMAELNETKHQACANARGTMNERMGELEKKESKDIKSVHCRINKSLLTNTKFILILAGIIVSLSLGIAGVVVAFRDSAQMERMERTLLSNLTFAEEGE